jgi:predicted nuclease of predicted toxin-antitoxin system
MNLLLDENLPIKLKSYFSDNHSIKTVREMNWSGKKNGELLELMILQGFEALVTIDKNLNYQQNIRQFNILIIILNSPDNKLKTLEPYIKELELKLSRTLREKVIENNIG